MPILSGNAFIPPKKYRNGHYSTLIPNLFGTAPRMQFERVRIETPDDDFIDLDFVKKTHADYWFSVMAWKGIAARNIFSFFQNISVNAIGAFLP